MQLYPWPAFTQVSQAESLSALQRPFTVVFVMQFTSQAYVWVINNDASGWSDVGDREAWAMHHDYVYRTTTARGDISLEKIWGGIKAVLAKRGIYTL